MIQASYLLFIEVASAESVWSWTISLLPTMSTPIKLIKKEPVTVGS